MSTVQYDYEYRKNGPESTLRIECALAFWPEVPSGIRQCALPNRACGASVPCLGVCFQGHSYGTVVGMPKPGAKPTTRRERRVRRVSAADLIFSVVFYVEYA